MTEEFFLGANSANGFRSLYDGFCRGEGDYLSVIKGGPGTGKSGFMRRIGKAAEERGYDVQYLLCSGDPESLDGVYIPALHRGWVDGTAPHVSDPSEFGINGDYVNLGAFCRTPLLTSSPEARALFDGYREQYKRAYSYLAAAQSIRKAYLVEADIASAGKAAAKRAEALLPKSGCTTGKGKTAFRFMRCICCKGEVCLNREFAKLSGNVIALTGPSELADIALKWLAEGAANRRYDIVVSLSPMVGEEYDAVSIPALSLSVVNERYQIASCRKIHLERLLKLSAQEKKSLSRGLSMEKVLMNGAFRHLSEAKVMHDRLETILGKAMDFDALSAFTDAYISKLFD